MSKIVLTILIALIMNMVFLTMFGVESGADVIKGGLLGIVDFLIIILINEKKC
jgi:hypothetical protein